MQTALSKVANYDKLFCKGELNTSSMRVNNSALDQYERLRQNSSFHIIEREAISKDSTTLLLLNLRSMLRHEPEIASDNRLINNYILGFTETQI